MNTTIIVIKLEGLFMIFCVEDDEEMISMNG